MYSKILFLVLLVNLIKNSLTCNGYKAKLVHYENCGGPDQIITIEDGFEVKLNKNCELVPQGCIINKGFETAIANINVYKNGMKMKEGQFNVCEVATKANNEQKNWMKLFSMKENCPIEEGKVCANGQAVSISKYKNMLAFLKGNFVINATFQHENNGISCFVINLDITK